MLFFTDAQSYAIVWYMVFLGKLLRLFSTPSTSLVVFELSLVLSLPIRPATYLPHSHVFQVYHVALRVETPTHKHPVLPVINSLYYKHVLLWRAH